MVSHPKRLPSAATVGDVRRLFRDDHVHAALIVTQAGCLAAVVERCDISGRPAPDDARAAPFGRLAGRVILPGASVRAAWLAMTATGQRRHESSAPTAGFWACCASRPAMRASALTRMSPTAPAN